PHSTLPAARDPDYGTRAVDQLPSEVGVAALRDAEGALFPATQMLSRGYSEPGGKGTCTIKAATSRQESGHGGGDDRPHPRCAGRLSNLRAPRPAHLLRTTEPTTNLKSTASWDRQGAGHCQHLTLNALKS